MLDLAVSRTTKTQTQCGLGRDGKTGIGQISLGLGGDRRRPRVGSAKRGKMEATTGPPFCNNPDLCLLFSIFADDEDTEDGYEQGRVLGGCW